MFIDANRHRRSGDGLVWGVEPICAVLQFAPQTYYAARKRPLSARALRDEALKPQIVRVYEANLSVYGADNVWGQLNKDGIDVARCTVERLMRDLGLAGCRRGRTWVRTTEGDERLEMGMIVRRLGVALFAGAVALASAAAPVGAQPATKIDVCCAWNNKIADGITYSVSAPTAEIADAVAAAIEQWELAVPGMVLNRVSGKGAEVTVKYKRGGGQVQGQARRSFDGAGFITLVSINISGSAFGNPNEPAIVAQIVKHEFGHALGANHADGDGRLMSPTVSAGSPTITQCDEDAVVAAQHWFLVDPPQHRPHVTSVACV